MHAAATYGLVFFISTLQISIYSIYFFMFCVDKYGGTGHSLNLWTYSWAGDLGGEEGGIVNGS